MTERMRRVNESVRAVVAEAVGGLGDPRLGIVTVTGTLATSLPYGTWTITSTKSGQTRKAAVDLVPGDLPKTVNLVR